MGQISELFERELISWLIKLVRSRGLSKSAGIRSRSFAARTKTKLLILLMFSCSATSENETSFAPEPAVYLGNKINSRCRWFRNSSGSKTKKAAMCKYLYSFCGANIYNCCLLLRSIAFAFDRKAPPNRIVQPRACLMDFAKLILFACSGGKMLKIDHKGAI